MRSLSPSSLFVGTLTALVVGVAAFTACGGSSAAPVGSCSGDCSCSGTTCTCNTGGTCTFGNGVEADGAPAPGPEPSGVTYNCDSKNTCNASCGTGCTTTCDGQSTCVGSCDANCTSTCGGTSNCTLNAGQNSNVTCEGGSVCEITVDTGSTLTCTGNSTCNEICPKGGCTLDCQGSGTCTVTCGLPSDAGTAGNGADGGGTTGVTACTIKCGSAGGKSQTCAPGAVCTDTCKG